MSGDVYVKKSLIENLFPITNHEECWVGTNNTNNFFSKIKYYYLLFIWKFYL